MADNAGHLLPLIVGFQSNSGYCGRLNINVSVHKSLIMTDRGQRWDTSEKRHWTGELMLNNDEFSGCASQCDIKNVGTNGSTCCPIVIAEIRVVESDDNDTFALESFSLMIC